MGSIFGGGPSIKLAAPPPPPAIPEKSETAKRLEEVQLSYFEENLARQRTQQEEEAATRTAIEESLGMPFEDIIAGQSISEFSLLKDLREQQTQSLARLDEQREAFIQATGITPEAYAAEESARQLTLGRGLQDRYEKALRGELEIDPGLERTIQQEATDLEEFYRRQLGSGYRLSSPYLEERDRMLNRHTALRTAAQRGEITRAEQIGFSLSPALQREIGTQQGLLAGIPNASPFDFSRSLSQLDRGFLATPPQAGPLTASLSADRALAATYGLAGYQGQLDFNRMVNQSRIQSAQQQGGAQSGLLAALIQGGATLGYGAIRGPASAPAAPVFAGGGGTGIGSSFPRVGSFIG